jgi:hypothetical protein
MLKPSAARMMRSTSSSEKRHGGGSVRLRRFEGLRRILREPSRVFGEAEEGARPLEFLEGRHRCALPRRPVFDDGFHIELLQVAEALVLAPWRERVFQEHPVKSNSGRTDARRHVLHVELHALLYLDGLDDVPAELSRVIGLANVVLSGVPGREVQGLADLLITDWNPAPK